jgi:Protein of unknown function (DUF3159)
VIDGEGETAMGETVREDDGARDDGARDDGARSEGARGLGFDRHVVLEQLGGWRGMVDASLPTVAFIVGNSIRGLTAGIWSAAVAAVLIFLLRLVRRQSVQQALSGLLAVAVAVAIAAYSGHARDYFVLGILRNAAIGVVLIGSALVRRPLIGYAAEFLAPSHLGELGSSPLPLLRARRGGAATEAVRPARRSGRPVDPAPERHWRDDRRMRRAYAWLTVMWGATFLLRVVVQGPLYQANAVGWLGTSSLLLGLPVSAVALVVTLWVVARLHRHRCPEPARAAGGAQPPAEEQPAA